MTRSHRAGGPEYNPNTGMRVNEEHTENPPERSLRVKPTDEHVKGVNFPYRGLEQHGVPFEETIPEELEGSPSHEDLTLVLPPHYAPKPHTPKPVPVVIVQAGAIERKEWQADRFLIGSTPVMILGRQDNRNHVIVRNTDLTNNNVYIGPSPNVTPDIGFPVAAVGDGPNDVRFETTEAIYAVADAGKSVVVSVMWEYSVKI